MSSEREYPSRPLVGAAALILDRGKVLLVQRGNPPSRGLWSVPGGLVELGESINEALVREIAEELGIRVKVGALFEVVNAVHLDEKERVRYHFVIIDYLAKPLGKGIRLNPESTAFGWFSFKQVEKLDMNERTREVVLRCLKRRGKRPGSVGS